MRGKVILAMASGPDVQVPADIFGDWAVHSGPNYVHGRGNPKPAWQVTHVPSGMAARCMETCGMTKAEAFKIARHLAKTLPAGVAEPDKAFGERTYVELCRALGVPDLRRKEQL